MATTVSRRSHFDDGLNRVDIEEKSNSPEGIDRWLAAVALGQIFEDWSLEILWTLKSDSDENTRNAAVNALRGFPQELLARRPGHTEDISGDFKPGIWKLRPLPKLDTTNRNIYLAAVLDITGTEGPTTGTRLQNLLSKASGITSSGRLSKTRMKSLIEALLLTNAITRADSFPESDDIDLWIVHPPNTPECVVRPRNSRELTEIPVNEARAVFLMDPFIDPDFPNRDSAFAILTEHYEIKPNEYFLIGEALATQWQTLFA